MTWAEAIADETLRDLPYKIELDVWGNVVMRPTSNQYRIVQAEMALNLNQHHRDSEAGGLVSINSVIATSEGVKVADVVWLSAAFFARNEMETPYKAAPDLCADIVSPSSTKAEMALKRDLYLAKGAQEVWTCTLEGEVSFFNHRGEMARSNLFANFPSTLEGLPQRDQ